jgi:hypothetical protein
MFRASYDVSPSTFVWKIGRWYKQVLVRPPVEQILVPMQADEMTEQAMIVPEKSAIRLDDARIEVIFVDS